MTRNYDANLQTTFFGNQLVSENLFTSLDGLMQQQTDRDPLDKLQRLFNAFSVLSKENKKIFLRKKRALFLNYFIQNIYSGRELIENGTICDWVLRMITELKKDKYPIELLFVEKDLCVFFRSCIAIFEKGLEEKSTSKERTFSKLSALMNYLVFTDQGVRVEFISELNKNSDILKKLINLQLLWQNKCIELSLKPLSQGSFFTKDERLYPLFMLNYLVARLSRAMLYPNTNEKIVQNFPLKEKSEQENDHHHIQGLIESFSGKVKISAEQPNGLNNAKSKQRKRARYK